MYLDRQSDHNDLVVAIRISSLSVCSELRRAAITHKKVLKDKKAITDPSASSIIRSRTEKAASM
jgi:hypothetical protein